MRPITSSNHARGSTSFSFNRGKSRTRAFDHARVGRRVQGVFLDHRGQSATSKFGELDILVNNGGVFIGKGIEEISLDEWNQLVAVNMTGVLLGTKLAAQALREAAKSSDLPRSPASLARSLDPLYSMTKGGVTLFTKSAVLAGRASDPGELNSSRRYPDRYGSTDLRLEHLTGRDQ